MPQFGDWDQKGQVPDYSLDFSKIRETRKQNKTNISRASLGNEEEFMDSTTSSSVNTGHSSEHPQPHYHQTNSPTVRFLSSQASLFFIFGKLFNTITVDPHKYCSYSLYVASKSSSVWYYKKNKLKRSQNIYNWSGRWGGWGMHVV